MPLPPTSHPDPRPASPASSTPPAGRWLRWGPWLAGLIALALIATGLWRLEAAGVGLQVSKQRLGATPVTVFRPAAAAPAASAPVVLIAHGFAGSQQLMQPFATTLAHHGFVAITFDFPPYRRPR